MDRPASADALFAALADSTRRAVLAALAGRPQPVGEIAAAFAISRPAISKHLEVLRQAGLVKAHTRGRERVHVLVTVPAAAALLREWAERLGDGAPVSQTAGSSIGGSPNRATYSRASRAGAPGRPEAPFETWR